MTALYIKKPRHLVGIAVSFDGQHTGIISSQTQDRSSSSCNTDHYVHWSNRSNDQ